MSPSKVSYILRYFNSTGLAESSRILLTAAGAKWTEEHPEWPQEKANQPHGRMPVLIEKSTDGSPDFIICESGNIERYLARTFGFLPANLKQVALQEQIHDLIADVVGLFTGYVYCKNEEDKEGFFAGYTSLLEKLIEVQTTLLQDNGNTGQMFGSKLSYADIITYGFYINMMVNASQFRADIANVIRPRLTPELVKLFSTVESDPQIMKHRSKDGSLVAIATD